MEVINRCLQTYLWCFVIFRPKDWMQFLTLAEYWHNTNVNSSTGYTPFEAVYGCKPSKLVRYIDQSSSLPQLDELLRTRSSILQLLRQNLRKAQNHMKTFDDYACSRNANAQLQYENLSSFRHDIMICFRSKKRLRQWLTI